MTSIRLAAAFAFVATALCACHRGGGGAAPPVANAGADQLTWKGHVVTLDGRGSRGAEGDALAFQWRQLEGPTVALPDDRAARVTFIAPRATCTLRFALEVSDGRAVSAPDEVAVTVRNRPPLADAGADQVTVVGHVVTLDPGGSDDPDGDPIAGATWYQRSGPPVALAPTPGGSATFLAPAAAAVLEFGLVVSDGEADSFEDVVRVTVVDEGANWPPIADAGPDREVARRAVVALQGSGLDRESDPLTWAWVQTGGPSVALMGADGPSPSFVAPADEADLEFQLVVADALSTGSDRVAVRVRNQAPVVASLALGPAAPATSDTLVASALATDPDQDPVTLSWEWRRNGSVLTGETGPTIAPGLTTRGDVFVARVTASDGALEASAEASVPIQDSPPILTVSAPETARWGEPVAFTASVSDADGDPVDDLALLHGPAGMTLSAAGEGAWTPTLPMFDRALDVRFAVGLAGSPERRVERSIRVEDPARAYPLRRTGIEIPSSRGGLVAADLDLDGTAELLVASRVGLYELAHAGDGYAQRWVHPFAAGPTALAAVEAGDVDGDGLPEIFLSSTGTYASTPGVLVKLDGGSRREVARAALDCVDLEAADLDRDGALELVCLSAEAYDSLRKAIVLDPVALTVRWETAELALGASVALGNVDADVALELVAAGGYVLDGSTGASEWVYGGGFGETVDVGDLDGDGLEEIVGMDPWDRFRGFRADLRAPIWEQTTFDNDALLLADVDGDEVAEILVGDGQWGDVTAYRYRPATNDVSIVFAIDSQEHGVTSLAVADLDGDGALEIAWGSGASSSGEDVLVVAGLDPDLGVEWKNVDPSQLDGPFVGAKPARTTAGAAPGLLFEVPSTDSGYAGTRLVRLDPATGAVAISPAIDWNWSNAGALAVADYDGDGVDEALLATSNYYDGYFSAWDFAAGAAEWTSPRNVGSGRAATHADLNRDGAPDLVAVTAEGYVQAWDVENGALLWKSTGLGGGADVEVADVDGDGEAEIVALSGTRLVLFREAPGAPVPWLESASAPVSGFDLAVADCDGDGLPELYVLGGSSGLGGTSVTRLDGALSPLGGFPVRGTAQSLHVEDLGFARKNLVLAKGDRWAYSGTAAHLEAVDPVTGASVWESPPLWGTVPPNSLGYVDLDGDGFRELAFGTSAGMYLTRGPGDPGQAR